MSLSKFQIIALVFSILWIFGIVELVRQRKLIGGYSLVWLFSGLVLIIFALREDLLLQLTHLVGLVYPPSTFFALVLIFLILIILDFSIKLSKLTKQNNQMAQKIALLTLKKNYAKKQK